MTTYRGSWVERNDPIEPELARVLARLLGVALWHVTKAGLVRNNAQRRVAELVQQLPPEAPLSERLAAAIERAP